MTRTDPGATSGTSNHATQRPPCTCSHSETSHRFRLTKSQRGKCTVTTYLGACTCKAYREATDG